MCREQFTNIFSEKRFIKLKVIIIIQFTNETGLQGDSGSGFWFMVLFLVQGSGSGSGLLVLVQGSGSGLLVQGSGSWFCFATFLCFAPQRQFDRNSFLAPAAQLKAVICLRCCYETRYLTREGQMQNRDLPNAVTSLWWGNSSKSLPHVAVLWFFTETLILTILGTNVKLGGGWSEIVVDLNSVVFGYTLHSTLHGWLTLRAKFTHIIHSCAGRNSVYCELICAGWPCFWWIFSLCHQSRKMCQ